MNRLLNRLFGQWKNPVIFIGAAFVLLLILVMLQIAFRNRFSGLVNIFFFIYLISMLGLLLSALWLLYHKKKREALKTFLTLIVSVVLLVFISFAEFWIGQSTPDRFTDGLTIPDNLDISEPENKSPVLYGLMPDSMLTKKPEAFDFYLFKGIQPGIYDFGIWLDKIDSGTVYLKAYEVRGNIQLSANELRRGSSLAVSNSFQKLRWFYTDQSFTIYEGDWGHPYAARFEVWFTPLNGQSRKIQEKNFIIEGWER